MKNNNLISGALILSVGSMLAKVFSAVYRIVLTRILGGVGIGIYQLIFPLFSLCVVLSTAGLPMAISKVIAKNKGKEKTVLKKCFMFSAIISLTLSFLLIAFSKPLALLQGKSDIAICYVILAPTIIFVSFASVLRGFFQGKHNFVPSAVSNIIEQFAKLVLGLVLTLFLIKVSLMTAIIGAVVGIVASEIVSLFVLWLFFKKHKLKSNSENVDLKGVFKDIIPITLTNVILPIATFIDSLLVVNLLSISFTREMSIFMYGMESGAVSSLVSLPTIFSFAVASVILPNLTKTNSGFNKNQNLSFAIKVVLIICVPCVLCFLLIPNRLIEVLYADRLNGFGVGGLNIAYRLLSISGLGIIFLAINQIYSSSLQAVDERSVTIRNLLIGVGVKFFIELIFMPSKLVNIYALAVANTACYLTVACLNHFEIRQHFKFNLSFMFAGKLILSNCLMLAALISVMMLGKTWTNTLLALCVAAIVYLVCLFKFKIFNRKEMATIKFRF